MITDVLRYPIRGAAGRTGLLALGAGVIAMAVGFRYAVALAPAAVALLPATGSAVALVLSLGYLARVLVDDGPNPPAPSLRRVVRAGVLALVLSVVFLVPPTGVLLLAALAATGPGATPVGDAPLVFLVGSTSALVLFLASAYVLPAAVAEAVTAGRLRAAVDADALLSILTDGAYLSGWAVGFPLVVVAGGLASVTIGAGDVVGVLAAFSAAYLLTAGSRAVGRGRAGSVGGT